MNRITPRLLLLVALLFAGSVSLAQASPNQDESPNQGEGQPPHKNQASVPTLLKLIDIKKGQARYKEDLYVYKLTAPALLEQIKEQSLELYKFRDSPDIAGNYTSLYEEGTHYHVKGVQPWGGVSFKVQTPNGLLSGEHQIDNITVIESYEGVLKMSSAELVNQNNRMKVKIGYQHQYLFISIFHETGTLSLLFNPKTGFYEGTTDNGMDADEEILNIDMNPEIMPGDILMKDFVEQIERQRLEQWRAQPEAQNSNKQEPAVKGGNTSGIIKDTHRENPDVAQILFLFDRRLMNVKGISYTSIRTKAGEGIEEANRLLLEPQGYPNATVSYKTVGAARAPDTRFPAYKKRYINAFEIAPQSLCPIQGCSLDYRQVINAIEVNTEVRNLKKKYNADLVVYIHEDRSGTTVGMANWYPTLSTLGKHYANKMVAVVDYFGSEDDIAHEIFHLLGAGHSDRNPSQYGYNGDGNAYMWVRQEADGTSVKSIPTRTFMAYDNYCKTLLVGATTCDNIEKLSRQGKLTKVGTRLYFYGSPSHSNIQRIIREFKYSTTWSYHYNP